MNLQCSGVGDLKMIFQNALKKKTAEDIPEVILPCNYVRLVTSRKCRILAGLKPRYHGSYHYGEFCQSSRCGSRGSAYHFKP